MIINNRRFQVMHSGPIAGRGGGVIKVEEAVGEVVERASVHLLRIDRSVMMMVVVVAL
jgi:hypothetical protein